jgi:hypothetical protein
MTATGALAEAFAEVIHDVDESIGENRTYGGGIGPHDEDDQIDALVETVRDRGLFDCSIYTVKSDSSEVRHPGGQSADIVLDTGDGTEYCEAKLFRFQKANEQPSSRGFSKVFNPYQDKNPRSFIHDVSKLAVSDIRATKTFLAPYYRPVNGAGTDITSEEIARKFVDEVSEWTEYTLTVDSVAEFSGLQHAVHCRGAFLTWELENQPEQYF